MLHRHALMLVLSGCLLVPWPSAAAQLADLTPGQKIRVRAPGAVAGRLTAIVISRSADSLVLASSSSVRISVPLPAIQSIDVSRGKSHGRGAFKGVAVGLPIGLALGWASSRQPPCATKSPPTCEPTVTDGGAFMIGLAGFMFSSLGGVIGAFAGSERWDRVTLPVKLGLMVPSSRGGFGLVLRWPTGVAADRDRE